MVNIVDENEETAYEGSRKISQKNHPAPSVDALEDQQIEAVEENEDATWGEVFETCCIHTPKEWGMIFVGLLFVFFFLYFFLFALELLGSSAKVMTGCKAGALFGDETNPVAGLMIGIISTALLQSSSTTTSIVVSMVGSAISVNQGIYMIMGANIGTTITNTIVALGQLGDGAQLERAFAGATVHDMFNYMTVAVLFPLEIATGYLAALTGAMVKNASTKDGETWEGPVKKFVAPLGAKIMISNKKLIESIAQGEGSCSPGGGFYPIVCNGPPSYENCDQVGLIACDKNTGACPSFFVPDATAKDDKVSGGVVFFISIVILFTCLLGLVTILQKMLMSMSTRIIHKATDMNGYLAIAVGTGITMMVQSSSITTSALTPLVGMGVLSLEQMYPLTLGANIGTTVTALMAAMVTEGTQSLQVALAHLFFNVTGIFIFYPIPFMRRIPMNAARQLGKATRIWLGFPFLYIAVMFFALPLVFLGISFVFEQGTKGFVVLGSFMVIILALGSGWLAYYCKFRGGRQACIECFRHREKRRLVMKHLPEDMHYLKEKMAALLEITGIREDEDGGEDEKMLDVSSNEEEFDA